MLQLDSDNLVLWLEDSRAGGTVHASEVRWITFDPQAGTINVYFICFPESWSASTQLISDTEFGSIRDVDWSGVLESFQNRDLICSVLLVEDLASVSFSGNAAVCFDMTLVEASLDHAGSARPSQTRTAEVIRIHRYPDGHN